MSLPALMDEAWYNLTYWSAFYGFTFGWSFRATGYAHLPRTGPVLIVSNHQSFLDPVLIGTAANRRLTYLARQTLFDHPILARIIRHYQAVPIDRGFGKEGLQTVLSELARAQAVLMFPEGERTHTGALQPLKPGVSLLIKRLDCPIVPAAVAGGYDAWPRDRKWPLWNPLLQPDQGRSIAVAFGPAIDPSRYRGLSREAMLTDLQGEIAQVHAAAEKIRRKGSFRI
ncbi:MAG: 1-acyl-sn-glycerol-3-phosphate acyltransferase [Bacteroidales bacterium]|nr:1-acyl-sn-glycerol-3-phosphate acyltransferase [Bacteroidales bacterium]